MSKRKFTKRKSATQDLDPAALAEAKKRARLTRQAVRRLLNRRRRKSGQ
jgi:hypothetical protein